MFSTGVRRLTVLAFLLVGLAACSGKIKVHDVRVQSPTGLQPISGKYAGTVQSGAWNLTTKPVGWACGAWRYETNINAPYERVMKQLLKDSVQELVFVNQALTPEEMQAQGFEAQIFIYQTNATSNYSVATGFVTATARSNIELSVVVAVTDKSGLSYQTTVTGKGHGSSTVFATCNPGDGMNQAVSSAMGDLGRLATLYIREGIRNRQ